MSDHLNPAVADIARRSLAGLATLLLGYLVVLAVRPRVRLSAPEMLQWLGRPGSVPTIALVAAALGLLVALIFRSYGIRETGTPVAVVAGLALISLVLGFASYWDCHDEIHPRFFTALMWTAGLVKGGIGDQSLGAGTCPSPTPVALEVARLAALAAVFLSVAGVAVALFRSGLDRLRVRLARLVTVVVDLDSDAESMLAAIAKTVADGSTLVVLAGPLDPKSEQEARSHRARIIHVDFRNPGEWADLSLWSKIQRLYLLSPDPSANLARLNLITERLSKKVKRQRIPLIVRIDDPWQAAAWRSEQFGSSQTLWAFDAVGKYEVTASRLLDSITAQPGIDHVLVCGNSQLTMALCADLARRQLEHDYYASPGDLPLPRLTVIAANADELKRDHEFARSQLGLQGDRPDIQAIAEPPSVTLLTSLLGADAPPRAAVIFVDSPDSALDPSAGIRIAARFPATPIYAWDPKADDAEERPLVVGRMQTFRLSMDVPDGQAQDTWERAARLIHDRYAAQFGNRTAATQPWKELDEFYRESNRREVRNVLSIVERIGGQTWNTVGSPPVMTSALSGLPPLEQLRLMGFDRDTAIAMARAEHEDWRAYYRDAGWVYGQVRNDACRVHDKLVDWADVEADQARLDAALGSLAATLVSLRQLGYRSRPNEDPSSWKPFRRRGTVLAEQMHRSWMWTADSGERMQAAAGDWALRDPEGGHSWSVRDDIFRSGYEHVEGAVWRRCGTVLARPAREGETVETLEGAVTARAGDWVVQGATGERWPVPGEQFALRYEGPLADQK